MLVDTSVWIDHLRRGNATLCAALECGSVMVHPWVIGELACGSIRNRLAVLGHLGALEHVPLATDTEVLGLIDTHSLVGTGIGWIDAHLLASARLAHVPLMTSNRALGKQAKRLGVAYT